MMNKKQVFAAVALIAIAMTTIAWAQASFTEKTITLTKSEVTALALPTLVVEPEMERTGTELLGLKIKVYFTNTVVRASLTDLGGLYEGMKQFVVTFKANSTLYAVLRLDEPVAEFVYDATGKSAGTIIKFDVVISYMSKKVIPASIKYTVSAEVVDVYGDKLTE
jgi:hypothetical protein